MSADTQGPEAPPAPPADPSRELWVFIGRLEERTRAARVVASWKRYCAHHAPNNHEAQALLSKVALEILCTTGEEATDAY
jgi:hypothetical protein